MPVRALRPCAKIPCCGYRAVGSKYCENHAGESKRQAAEYEDRKSAMAKLRACKRWRQGTRRIVLMRDPICTDCKRTASTDCDHDPERAELIVAKYGINEFYNPDRCKGKCKSCHSRHTALEVGFAGAHA